MNIQDVSNALATILRNNHIELGISQDAIYVQGEKIGTLAIAEYISIAVIPKESISLENFPSNFWKCTVEITVFSPTIFRSFDIVHTVMTIIEQASIITLSQTKIHKIQSTSQSTSLQLIAQTILELR